MLKLSLLLVVGISLWLVESSLAQTTTQARLCDPGKYKATSGCVLCAAGYFCTGYTTTQTICPAGTMSNTTGQSACTPCSPGSYALTTGSKVCTVAAAGYFAPNATKLTICPVGTSTNNQTGQTQCTPCEPGYVATVAGSKSCTWCPEGSYCPNATSAILCPKGKASRYNSSDYFRDYTRCKLCPIGTTASVAGSKMCSPCTNGSYCPNPFIPPIPCPKGKSSMVDNNYSNRYFYGFQSFNYYYMSFSYDQWSNRISANGQSYNLGERCYECPIGFYASSTGSTLCKQCPDGYYCNDKKLAPQPCPKGTYSNNMTLWNQIYWPYTEGDTCKRCPQGTYANKTASSQCLPCPNGFICDDPALNPRKPPAGHGVNTYQSWSNDNTYITYTSMYACSAGQYVEDPANPWMDTDDGDMNNTSTQDPNNSSMPPPTTTSSYPWYTSSPSQMYPYCKSCPIGHYCPTPFKPPQKCSPGLVPNQQYGSAWMCTSCSSGQFAAKNGTCVSCPRGSYCPSSSSEPILCPRGTYSWEGQSRCSSCYGGSYTLGEGSTECKSCPIGCCCVDPAKDPVCPYEWTPETDSSTTWSSWWPNWNDTTTWSPWSTPGWNETYPPWTSQNPNWNGTNAPWSSQYPTGSSPMPTGSSPMPTNGTMMPTGSSPIPTGSSPMPTGSTPKPTNGTMMPTSAPLGR